ncbi:hypothetical protein [Actinophytocola glycyrrhizae]|uniref:Uncharacterized protein n=1 Tax=Actinophytocola glycyrrhizae TaxID=2044873 RepID=A0ABV9SGZ3_9PSEU
MMNEQVGLDTDLAAPADDTHALLALLALLPWQHDAAGGLFPPDALRRRWLGVDARSMPTSLADVDGRWMSLTNVGTELKKLITADAAATPEAAFILAMRVLDTFEPMDLEVARSIGTLLPTQTAGRLWLQDVTATAWQVVVSVHGDRRLADLRGALRDPRP